MRRVSAPKKSFLLLLGGVAFAFAPLSGGDALKDIAKDLQGKRNCEEMIRLLTERLEDREEYLQMGIDGKKIDPREEKKIRSSLEKLRKIKEKLKEKGTMNQKEKQAVYRELANCYRMIWFYSRKEKIFSYSLYGKMFYLKEPWQTKYQRATLSGKDMEDILKVIEQIRRMRIGADKTADKEAASLKKEVTHVGEKLLLEKFFTLEKPEEPPAEKSVKNRSGSEKKSTSEKIKQPQAAKNKEKKRQKETPNSIKQDNGDE